MKVVITEGFIWIFGLLYRPRKPTMERGEGMAAGGRGIELSPGEEDKAKLRSIAQSRTEPASRVERARILLAYRPGRGRSSREAIAPRTTARSTQRGTV